MTSVYVVLGENGEYESRSIWLCGVYSDRNEAEAAMALAVERRRKFERWSDTRSKHWRHLDTRGVFGWKFPLSPEDEVEHKAIGDEAERRAGPKPEYEPAEHLELFLLPTNQWQNTYSSALLAMSAAPI